jgi:flavodoxin
MKIGIIVHSSTGNTLSVAERLAERFRTDGHSAVVERLKVLGDAKPGQDVDFEALPDLNEYDALVFGAPVAAFSLSPAMQKYMRLAKKERADRVALLITQHFPYSWMGGSRARGQLKKAVEGLGYRVVATGIINWSRKEREKQIAEVVEKLGSGLTF